MTTSCGRRGCSSWTKRQGVLRHCAQQAVIWKGGRSSCYYHYHNPDAPHTFGGYSKSPEAARSTQEALERRGRKT